MMRFSTFIGVDQTGATYPGGRRARPLPAALLVRQNGSSSYRLTATLLESASRERFDALVAGHERPFDASCAIVLDCVLGLPDESWARRERGADAIWALLRQAGGTPGFGRETSERFFARLHDPRSGAPLPRRSCERLCNANSVFLTRPFQKNVQTGTFRLWKDLASGAGDSRWFSLWPFEASRSRRRPWLFEGYPTLFWKQLFGFARRSPESFDEALARAAGFGVEVEASRAVVRELRADGDLADAAMLALGAAVLQQQGLIRKVHPGRVEGWILGLDQKKHSKYM